MLQPDPAAHTVTLAKAFVNPSATLLASSQGTMVGLPGGNWLLGYGGLPNFTEFDASGGVLLDGTLGAGVQSFRTSLSPWSGRPATAPSAVVVTGPGAGRSVAVSWNGATGVASWRLLAGPSPRALAPVATAPRSGFQSTVPLAGSPAYIAVQALDEAGGVMGASPAMRG